ncbi:beta strand repeat-containing protein [Sphingomonas sp. IC4-52]|uniref:beta strand repeat-containing protein n=1 Tax=Sphingomonas sp. IC4-52 TaxID=2887202 RepID=UPI001D12CB38|nr:cadherin-like domain-containing protein [Sphingomonas sp. IC4-52]MCC2981318.1 cadherin-like domain-containing protein [Sphingomonas sp. IC4-52]
MTTAALIAETIENQVNTSVAGSQTDAAIAALSDGGYVLCWTDASKSGADASGTAIRLRLFNAQGQASSAEILVNTTTAGAQDSASVAVLSNGNILVSWTDGSLTADNSAQGIRAQLFSATGTKIGAELLVNTTINGGQTASHVTALAGGGFVIGWVDRSGTQPDGNGSGIRGQMFSADATKIGNEFLINSTTAADQAAPALSALQTGGFVATWVDNSKLGGDASVSSIKAQLFSASGTKTGAEFLVNTTALGAQDQPVVATLANGRFVIAWRDASGIGDNSAAGLRAQVFDSTGAKVGQEILVNDFTLNTQAFASITATADGGFAVAWQDNSLLAHDASGYGIRAQMFDADGVKLGADFIMNANVTGNQTAPAIVGLAGGGIAAAWADSAANAIDPDGGLASRVFKPYTGTSSVVELVGPGVVQGAIEHTGVGRLVPEGPLNAQYSFNIVGDSTGGAFRIEGDILTVTDADRLDAAAGSNASLTLEVSDGLGGLFTSTLTFAVAATTDSHRFSAGAEARLNVETTGNQQQLAMARLADGRMISVWSDASLVGDTSGTGLKARLLDAEGKPVGQEFLVNNQTAGAQDTPSVAGLAGGGFVVAWTDASGAQDTSSTGIKARLFNADGVATGTEFLVNTATAGIQAQASVAALKDGTFIVTWRDESLTGGDDSVSSIKARHYSASGQALGDEFLVNTATASRQEAPDITALESGGFVITWSDSSRVGGDTSKDAIKVQVFDAGAGRVGSERLVNVATANNQQQPAIAATIGGGFVIAWMDGSFVGGDNSGFAIKVRRFDDDGDALGGEILANTTTGGSQIAPTITALPGGGFAVGWADYGGSGLEYGTSGVKTQLFAADGSRLGSESVIPIQVLGGQVEPVLVTRADGGFVVGWTDLSGQDGDISGSSVKARGIAATAAPTITTTPDQFAGVEDTVMIISGASLLANDVGSSGSPLSITRVSAISGCSVTLNAQGNVVFTPLPDFDGSATFSYVVTDASGTLQTGTVTVTLAGVADAPRGVTMTGGTVDENAAAGTLVATFAGVDPDSGDVLSYALANNAGGRFVIDAATGVLRVAGGAVLDYETTPTLGVVVTVTDLSGASFQQAHTISLANLPEPKSYTGTNGINNFTAPTDDLWTINGLGGNDVLNGAAFRDMIDGGAGNDIIDGRGGADVMTGGIGNDTYYIDDPQDTVIELPGEGTDLVYARANWSMSANIENLTIQGTSAVSIVGNNATNTITGNDAANTVFAGAGGDLVIGNGGDDILAGEDGSDFLQGGDGNDRLIGGAGADELTGGAGADIFVMDVLTTSVERDKIRDFVAGQDKFEISRAAFTALADVAPGALSASMFMANGVQAVTADQHFIYQRATGNLWYDPDGNGAAAQIHIAVLSTLPTLTAADFIVA